MAINFKIKDILHSIVAKFRRSTLPNARKPYNLYAAGQPTLDIHGIASKADVYNISTAPSVIEEGFTAALKLLYYLVADGYKIKTPFFDAHIRIPGEYDGTETHIHEGVKPEVAISVNAELRRYVAQNVQVAIIGREMLTGAVTAVTDISTDSHDTLVRGSVFSVEGKGLKIVATPENEAQCGLWFVSETQPQERLKCSVIADNKPLRLVAVTPAALTAGSKYFLEIITQSMLHRGGTLLKEKRTVRTEHPYLIA